MQTSGCYEIINDEKAVLCKRTCLKSLGWWQLQYVDCECSFQGCTFEAPKNKANRRGSEPKIAGSAQSRTGWMKVWRR